MPNLESLLSLDEPEGSTAADRQVGGAHTSRTMMSRELRDLLTALPETARREDYEVAIVGENVLGKATSSSRQRSFRYLRELYGLDPDVPSFRGLRRLWPLEPAGKSLLALASALNRDPALRSTLTGVLPRPIGARVKGAELAAAVAETNPGAYSDAVAAKIGRNAASTWTQSGHLVGRTHKTRQRAEPTPSSVAYAMYLAHLRGATGQLMFEELEVVAQDVEEAVLREFAAEASRRGWIRYRAVGNVIDVSFAFLEAPVG